MFGMLGWREARCMAPPSPNVWLGPNCRCLIRAVITRVNALITANHTSLPSSLHKHKTLQLEQGKAWTFSEVSKSCGSGFFLTLKTGTSGAQNKNLRPVVKFRLWRGYVVRNSLTFGHWKVVFSIFLILYRAFSHFMYLTYCHFRKRKMVQSRF